MKTFFLRLIFTVLMMGIVNAKNIKLEEVTYSGNDRDFKSYVAYDASFKKSRPVVMIVPEWWGVNDYVKKRAQQIAELGYFAMVVDMYGDGKAVSTPTEAKELATPFYQNPHIGKENFDAALEKMKTFSQADATKVAAIGYCFGGAMVLNMARFGENLKCVVSFHGGLQTGVKPTTNKVPMLVCHGEADNYVPKTEVDAFIKEMKDNKINYQFHSYPGAVHAFTNPDATELGKKFNMNVAYNKPADIASWKAMKNYLKLYLK